MEMWLNKLQEKKQQNQGKAAVINHQMNSEYLFQNRLPLHNWSVHVFAF